MKLSRRGAAALAIPFLLPARGRAQVFPSRPVRLFVPFPPAGSADFLARVVAEHMAGQLGQPFVVENRPGAGGNVGAGAVARGERDGHTIMLGNVGVLAVNRFLFRNLPFDADRDFAPIALLATVPSFVVVPPSLPVTTLAELIAYARARPRQLNYGSIGNGTSQHIASELFNAATGTELVHVIYRETSAANTDLMEGRVQVLFQSTAAVAELVRAGRMRALAITSAARMAAFPDVPTLRELGVDLVTEGWFGLVAPAGAPAEIVSTLERAAIAAVTAPAVSARLLTSGSVPQPLTGAEFARFVQAEVARMGPVLRAANVQAD
ncbi:MAG: tripartite tricarboxylate transporter substrate binding protein [Acetobacteraceae bacterium]|nr:tripartite tricarboxylate transporter substrate binding protein [Acetobacteraceae bacterium]